MVILYAGQQDRRRCREHTSGLSGRRQGWENVENSFETCTLLYVKQMTSASSVHKARHPKPVLWDSPE